MKRNSYIDNYKALLIILVVLTHFTGALSGKSSFFNAFQIYNNFFYMPAFIMISGYLSKKNDTLKLIKSLLIPYLFMQILNILLDMFITHESNSIALFYPKFTLWYLLSLFLWRISIKYVSKIKYGMIIMTIIALLSGFDTSIGTFMSLSRTIYFYPYFLLGYKIKDLNQVLKYKNKVTIMISVIALGIIFCYTYYHVDSDILNVLTGAKDYEEINLATWGWLYRLICYGIGYTMTFFIAMIVPQRKLFFTNLGKKTMSVYVFHGCVYQFIRHRLHLYNYFHTSFSYVILIIGVFLLIWILSRKPFIWIMQKISSVPIEKLKRRDMKL